VESLIRNKIRIQPLPPTLAMSYQDKEPLRAADILNEVMTEFLNYDKLRKTESSSLIIAFIDNQISLLGTEIQAYDNQLQLFRISHGLINASDMGHSIYSQLQEIKDKRFVL